MGILEEGIDVWAETICNEQHIVDATSLSLFQASSVNPRIGLEHRLYLSLNNMVKIRLQTRSETRHSKHWLLDRGETRRTIQGSWQLQSRSDSSRLLEQHTIFRNLNIVQYTDTMLTSRSLGTLLFW